MDCCSYLVFLGWGLFFWRFVISDKKLKSSFLGSIKEEKLNVLMFFLFPGLLTFCADLGPG